MTRRTLFSTLAVTSIAKAIPQQDPEKLIWSLESIPWQSQEYGGAKYAVLDGDRDAVGQPFTYAFWMPPNLWAPAHTHTQQAHVAVLKGGLLLGFGSIVRKESARLIPAGGFFIVRANAPHFEGCREETLIIGSGLGGWKTHEL